MTRQNIVIANVLSCYVWCTVRIKTHNQYHYVCVYKN